MNENLDLREILKDAPEGLRLWSPICGICEFKQIVKYTDYPIVCKTVDKHDTIINIEFTKDGKRDTIYPNGQCVLFPSETNHDWSTFKVPEYHKEFKPFEMVLRVDACVTTKHPWIKKWTADFFSYYDKDTHLYYCASGYIAKENDIIPYKDNEELLGTRVDC